MSELPIGAEFADHRIEALIGRGGMGVVYRATQLALDRPVALKVIAPELAGDKNFGDRFRQECRLAASIDHPNVVPVHEAGEEDGRLYVTMRYVEGTDLRREIDRGGPLDPPRAARIIADVAGALDAAHKRGLVHRDVKPGNTLIAGSGEQETAYLTDFGLTKIAGSVDVLTRTGQWVGTVDYVAPEQIMSREVDARTDVYALGCVLYEALTGGAPFGGRDEVAKMFCHLNDPAPKLPEHITREFPGLQRVIDRAMAKDPAERYPSAGDLGRAALAAVERRPVAEPERTVAVGRAAPGMADAPVPATLPTGDVPPVAAPPPLAVPEVAPTTARTLTLPPDRPEPPRKRGPRVALTAGAILALVLMAVLFATGVLGGGTDERHATASTAVETTASQPETTASTDTGTTPPPRPIAHAQVRRVLQRYVDAYSAENLAELRALLAPDVSRKSGTGRTMASRGEALQEYSKQFALLSSPRYVLRQPNINTTARDATVDARYRITDEGRAAGAGSIVFHLIKRGRALKIDRLRIQPD